MQILINMMKFMRDMIVSLKTIVSILIFNMKNDKQSCIMITNGMGYGGAPLVLMEAANVYKQNNYKVILLTEFYGALIKKYRKEGICVWIVPKGNKFIKKLALKPNYSLAFVNTIVMYKWIEFFSATKIPTLWWLHESDFYIDQIENKLPKTISENIKVLTVSERTVQALKKNNIFYDVDMLYYGINDISKKNKVKSPVKRIFKFLVIGAICERKNQIFSLKAYENLDDDIIKNSNIIFVGEPLNAKDKYYINFLKEIKGKPSVEYIPKVLRVNIPHLYEEIDVLICCSIDDPLPVVVTEGFMFGKIVIVSSGVGQYSLIRDGVNGYSYEVDNLEELVTKMTCAYKCMNDNNIVKNARETYDNFFSMDKFEERLISYTNEVIDSS